MADFAKKQSAIIAAHYARKNFCCHFREAD